MKKEYTQLELTTTDPKPLMRDLIAAWTAAEAPEGDGYHSLIDLYLAIDVDPARFIMQAVNKTTQVKLALENTNRVVSVIDHPKKWLEILESLMPEYGVETGNFFYFLQNNRDLICELSHVSKGTFLSDAYGTEKWPAYKFLKEGGREIYYGVDPRWGHIEHFATAEEAVAFSIAGGLHLSVLEVAYYVRSKA